MLHKNVQRSYLPRSDGDWGDPTPEAFRPGETPEALRPGENILGQDKQSTDQVKAIGESIKTFWRQDGLSHLANMPREGSDCFVPTEPGAASLLEMPKFSCYGSKVEHNFDEFADGGHVFVWRNSQWHPVSSIQQEQIQAKLSSGERVFSVSDGSYSWTVDTRKKSEWVQISASGTSRPLRCIPTVIQRDVGKDFLEQVKAEWTAISGQVDETDESASIFFNDLLRHYRKVSSVEDDELLFHVVEDIFQRATSIGEGPLTLKKWMHFRLLEVQAPSTHAIEHINIRMNAWMARYNEILTRFVDLFLQHCEDTGSMRLTTSQMKYAARTWFSQSSNAMFTKAYIAHLNNLMSEDDAFEEGENITYYEFLNYMTGQTWCDVELYFYDLTKGSAWWWTPLLFGRSMPHLWHCGVVVFGKEYRYGGNIFESTPGGTAFGTPQKVYRIGRTCRTRQELLSFINRSLSHCFAVDSYQVLSNNSNHFCDSLSMYLTNQHITDEVLEQPKDIMRSKVAESLSPWMPWLKGAPLTQTRTMISSQREWDLVQRNTLVSYEYEDGWIAMARVVAKYECSCDLRWYSRSDFKFHTRKGVSRKAVQPLLFGDGSSVPTPCLPQRKF